MERPSQVPSSSFWSPFSRSPEVRHSRYHQLLGVPRGARVVDPLGWAAGLGCGGWKGYSTEAFYLKEESLPTTLQFLRGPASLTGVGGPLALIPSPSYWWGNCWASRSVLRSYCSVRRAPPVACFQENRVEETFGKVLPPPSSFGCNVATPPPDKSS